MSRFSSNDLPNLALHSHILCNNANAKCEFVHFSFAFYMYFLIHILGVKYLNCSFMY